LNIGRRQEKEIVKPVTLDELNKMIKREEKSVRVLERLYFIKIMYKGDTIKEACKKVDISGPTGTVGSIHELARIRGSCAQFFKWSEAKLLVNQC
jgi:hypothetical protein